MTVEGQTYMTMLGSDIQSKSNESMFTRGNGLAKPALTRELNSQINNEMSLNHGDAQVAS